ncbi:MAG TPA: hypothetical protein GX716_08250 [Firmicutes bacterium]|nr:hypothetical protein [Candidatus Fermentithermobacillaceae bacterium]
MEVQKTLFKLVVRERRQIAVAACLVATAVLMLVVYSKTVLGIKASVSSAFRMGGPEDIAVTSQGEIDADVIGQISALDGVAHVAPMGLERRWIQSGWVECRHVDTSDPGIGLDELVVEGRLPREPFEVAAGGDFLGVCGLSLGESSEAWESMGAGSSTTYRVVGVLKNTMRTPWGFIGFLQDQPLRSLLVFCSERTEETIRAVTGKIFAFQGVTVTPNYAREAATREFVPLVNRAVQVLLIALLASTVFAVTNSLYLRLSSRRGEGLVLLMIGASKEQMVTRYILEAAAITVLAIGVFVLEAVALRSVVRDRLVWSLGEIALQGVALISGAVVISSCLAWGPADKEL